MVKSGPPELSREQRRACTTNDGLSSSSFWSVSDSVIGGDLSIEGQAITMRCKGSLRVNGRIEAELHCGELQVGPQALIIGSIVGEKVVISGRVEGRIFADSVFLGTTARVHGDINSRQLAIEEGAIFDGCSRKLAEREFPPEVEATGSAP